MSRTAQVMNADTALMRSIIQRIATGPELSKDISQEEAREGMRLILEGKVDRVQAAIFLIALRMKRETDEENLGVYDAIRDASNIVTAPVDELVDIADPYDGYKRTLPASPFLPAVLAACGVPAVSHGLETVGPKYGVTHRQVLRAAGAPVDLSPEQAAARLGDAKLGWAYIDQKSYCPALHHLVDFRTLIVKRPTITTVETSIGPVRARKKTHILTSYVHKPYARVYAMIARHAGFDSALIVRGVEGVIPSLRQPGKCFYYRDGGVEQELDLDPAELGIQQTVRAAPLPDEFRAGEDGEETAAFDAKAVAKAAAQAGLAALSGEAGPTRDSLVQAGAVCLWHLGRYPTRVAAAEAVRKALDSGAALERFKA